jgi:hypothetical protein
MQPSVSLAQLCRGSERQPLKPASNKARDLRESWDFGWKAFRTDLQITRPNREIAETPAINALGNTDRFTAVERLIGYFRIAKAELQPARHPGNAG